MYWNGQYRTNWSLAPALSNPYLRERFNLDASLVVKDTAQAANVTKVQGTNKAEAAAGSYKKLYAGILEVGLGERLLHYKHTRGNLGFPWFQFPRKSKNRECGYDD